MGEYFLNIKVRYWGQQVVQVQAGCQQKDACVSNMKQNFWQREGQIFDLNNARRHQCKIFSGNHALNSVCHTCCFDDNCNKKLQPNSIEEWMNIKGKSQVSLDLSFYYYHLNTYDVHVGILFNRYFL